MSSHHRPPSTIPASLQRGGARRSRRTIAAPIAVGAACMALAAQAPAAPSPATSAAKQPTPAVTTFATGLDNPRGLAFGPNGDLYVAEGGLGGSQATTPADCKQVPAPTGPYSGGFTARISKINGDGVRTTVVDGLPSSQTAAASQSVVSGVSGVAFIRHTLYALEAGAGCSHGLKGTDNSLLRVNHNGTTTQIADLSKFLKAHPVPNPDAADFEPDGTWYGIIRVGRDLYATEPNHQELDRITPDGHVSRVVNFSKSFPGNTDWRGPTAIASHGRFLYIGTLTRFPIVVGAAQVFKVDPRTGRFSVVANGLTTVLGLTFGPHHRLYVLESMTNPGSPGPSELGTGKVVQIDPSGKRTVIATGLSFPTAMTLGPDGAIYVSNLGFGPPIPGIGQIVRITIPR